MRRYVVFAAALLLLLLGSQAVLAQYGPGGQLTVSDANPPAGGEIVVTAEGFAPATPVQVTITSETSAPELLATVEADAAGAFSESVTIPENASGPYTLSATGTDVAGSVLVLTASIDVVAVTAPPTDTQPVTGTGRSSSDALVIAIAGAGIVLMTGFLLIVTHKRRLLR
jgi:hypothetical protein